MTFDPKSDKRTNALPFHLVPQSELVWWPYLSLSKSLLRTHRNASALLEINSTLAHELREIARRQQEFVWGLSEKLLTRKGDDNSDSKNFGVMPPESVDEIFETAICGIREFSRAIEDAQVRSLEAFQQHARDTAGKSKDLPNETPHAANRGKDVSKKRDRIAQAAA